MKGEDNLGRFAVVPDPSAAGPLPPKAIAPLLKAPDFATRAAGLVGGDREARHGSKKRNHDNIAALWQGFLEIRFDRDAPLTGHDVALMMALLKIARTQLGNYNEDDYVDLCGYGACAGEIRRASHFVKKAD